MIEHYKRLVKLVLQNHSCNAEEESYNPQGIELEAVLLASHIRELEYKQNALNQKESASGEAIPKMGDKSIGLHLQELTEYAKEQAQTIAMLSQQLADKEGIIRRLIT